MNDKSVSSRLYPAASIELKPNGTKTYDEDWRLTLKVGDEIDAYDCSGKWHRSTVVKAEERVTYDQPLIKVGFRYYHPDGPNKDNE